MRCAAIMQLKWLQPVTWCLIWLFTHLKIIYGADLKNAKCFTTTTSNWTCKTLRKCMDKRIEYKTIEKIDR